MEASAILHLYGCGVFKDEELPAVYEDLCERIVIRGDQLTREDEDVFLNLIEKVMAEKEATVDADGVVILVPSCPEKPISPIPTPSSVPDNVCEETRDNFSDNINRLTREYQIKEKEIRTRSNSPPKNGFFSPSFPKNMTSLLPHSLTTLDTVCENIEIQISESRNPIIYQDETTQIEGRTLYNSPSTNNATVLAYSGGRIDQQTTPHKEMLASSAENKNTFPTPFKNAFYWPESTVKAKIDKTGGTNKKSKIYPTVATSDEFIEHQRRVKKEKEKKDTKKRERIRIRKEKIKNKLVKRTTEQPIVYIDERYINESHTSIIQLQVLNPNRKGKEVIVHAGVKCVSSSFVDI
ncbi:hypothetical protein RN001_001322 [Aquatica leii]|uniref:Uncharacterized protein n=1 Tax=Aquatica leii TaxID=1421715 RepID=A0AAN7PNE5_9COLE|nr:hypothetical protein RN001_001322 [Aquatica leii]